jgi:ribulose-5-phosphate 4-epimerase/fuculose-1-phosphate aldolase
MSIDTAAGTTPAATDQVTEDELRTLVADSGRVLYQQGLMDYLGHCSARVPGTDRIVVKPKHSPRIRGTYSLTGSHMIVVDLDGRLIEGEDRPPAEVFIHTEIYKARPDVQAVVHTHQPVATVMGVMGAEIRPVLHVQSALIGGGPIPTWACPMLVTTPERGRDMVAALGDANVGHLQGHGIVSVAGDIKTATVQAVMLEQLAQANLDILQAGGTPRVIPADEIADLQREMAPVTGRWAYYMQLLDDQR